MAIFSASGGKLAAIGEIPFKLEKDLQNIVEKNLKTVFGLDFIVSEFELMGRRIDTLGFDPESKSFVVIEYKRDKNTSVIDQGFAYLSLLVNNKAEFILTFNENQNSNLKKNDIDWSQSKVIFVSPYFTPYQKEAIGFKDLPIELWAVKKYENKTVLFTQIHSPTKSESINKISSKSSLVRSVSKEVKSYSEEMHLEKCSENIKNTYRELRDEILSLGSDIKLKAKKLYVGFYKKNIFVDITLRKNSLDICLNLKKGTLMDPQNMARDVSKIGHWGNGDYMITMSQPQNLGYVLSLIRQSYENN